MKSVDTNVIVRFLTRDDPEQARRARLFLESEPDVVVPTTVLLETEWVLRAAYGFDRGATVRALRAMLGLGNVRAEDPARAYLALEWHLNGLDFADALHLASSRKATVLKTFDVPFVHAAAGLTSCSVEPL